MGQNKKTYHKVSKRQQRDRNKHQEADASTKKQKVNNFKDGIVKMTLSSIPIRQHKEKRVGRLSSGKRLAVEDMPGKLRLAYRRSIDPCENSNDSGLGFDHHTDRTQMGIADRLGWPNSDSKRARIDVKVENVDDDDDDNDGYTFPESARSSRKEATTLIRTAPFATATTMSLTTNQHGSSTRSLQRCAENASRQTATIPISLTTQLSATSRYSDASLSIIMQPEQQHRARYQTEGSRGAVKDRDGNGFPIVQLVGYNKPATLQVFIGTDIGKVSPHMFYQACKVSGKNSTPCVEKKIDGTCVIELQLDPSKEMCATCDCVGILKERNVDVEHRFPDQLGNRSKKKSTRCRMIFRTMITHEDGRQEALQVCSHPIVCTQPPGVPEICKKSLTACPAAGGLELFVLGKNFSKDTKVYFQQTDDERMVIWEQSCIPDKEYLQQTHFVCVIPPYRRPSITEPVSVRLFVVASGKTSESHQFVYTPVNGAVPSASSLENVQQQQQSPFFNKLLWTRPSVTKKEQDLSIMPPPETSMVPLSNRRSSISLTSQTTDIHSPPLCSFKQEFVDENSQNSMVEHVERFRHISESSMDVHHGDSNISMINENSMDIHHNIAATSSDVLHHDNSNLSINENSVEIMVRSNSMSGSILNLHESSMDVNLNEDSMHCSTANLLNQSLLKRCVKDPSEMKVIDLRMKAPMATVADLVGTSAPSMATLCNFGVAAEAPLPAQSAQSVENYLTNIESKSSPSITSSRLMTTNQNMPLTSHELSQQMRMRITDAVYVATNNNSILCKNDNAADKLDAFLNVAAGNFMNSRSDSLSKISMLPGAESQAMMPQLMVSPPQVTPTTTATTADGATIPSDVILNTQISPSLMCRSTQDAILPCQPPIENNLISQQQRMIMDTSPGGHATPISSAPLTLAEQEKAVIIEAAVDLLETQRKISDLECLSPENKEPILNKLYMNNYLEGSVASGTSSQEKSDYIIPISVKEMQLTPTPTTSAAAVEKKIEDRMISQNFTSLTENELINFINPSCFDQV